MMGSILKWHIKLLKQNSAKYYLVNWSFNEAIDETKHFMTHSCTNTNFHQFSNSFSDPFAFCHTFTCYEETCDC